MLPRINVVQCDDANFLLSVKDTVISQHLYHTGSWEKNILFIAKCLLHDVVKPWVLDIGANLGAFTVPIAKHIAEKSGFMTSFEPQRIVYYQLCGNIFLNRLDNCYAYNYALSDSESQIDIPEMDFNAHNNVGAFSLTQEYTQKHDIVLSNQKHTVHAIKLDNVTPR